MNKHANEDEGLVTWRELIQARMNYVEDSFDNVIAIEVNKEGDLDVYFDCGFVHSEAPAFTVYTRDYVYFPHEYDGSEYVMRIPRNPTGKPHNYETWDAGEED